MEKKPEKTFREKRLELGYSRQRFAELFDIASVTTIRNWEAEGGQVPGWAVAFVDFMTNHPFMKPWFEDRRPPVEEKKKAGRPKKRRASPVRANKLRSRDIGDHEVA